ncbi:hypothetical protein [Streptomonospora salina]|uniref:DUF8129 domain-containing protein n=1 Tax=Streptomonospora salina TaxID=104205 RepID=A0A841E8T9_9ACTN|nr:hypothetical protein [Streptomonospora salina]MBB5999416.1 hypothetical protein [Streptomonospora salina]
MSNPSIASKLMSMVKGIFGQKEDAAEPSPASAPAEKKAQTGTAESTTAAANGTATAAPAEEEAPAEKPVSAPAGGTEEKAAHSAETGASAPDASTGETSGEGSHAVTPEERAAVADELATAEATTQEADDSVLEGVRRQAAPAADDLPVPGYDDLTLPSIRARLRKLTIDQVRELRAYEVAHGERPEFIKMYDNRIAKLQSEDQE